MRKPLPYTAEQMLEDFSTGGKVYVNRLRGGVVFARVFVHTDRPLAWLNKMGGGAAKTGHWATNARKVIRRLCTVLLSTGKAEGEVRAKLELLDAYCHEDNQEKRSEIAALFADLRQHEKG